MAAGKDDDVEVTLDQNDEGGASVAGSLGWPLAAGCIKSDAAAWLSRLPAAGCGNALVVAANQPLGALCNLFGASCCSLDAIGSDEDDDDDDELEDDDELITDRWLWVPLCGRNEVVCCWPIGWLV